MENYTRETIITLVPITRIMDHGHKTFKYKFRTRNPKLFNQNAVLIVYDILIGCFQKVMTVRLV